MPEKLRHKQKSKITYIYKIQPEKIQKRNINLASIENENARENCTFQKKLHILEKIKMSEKFTELRNLNELNLKITQRNTKKLTMLEKMGE